MTAGIALITGGDVIDEDTKVTEMVLDVLRVTFALMLGDRYMLMRVHIIPLSSQ